jgi:hypothetical protein
MAKMQNNRSQKREEKRKQTGKSESGRRSDSITSRSASYFSPCSCNCVAPVPVLLRYAASRLKKQKITSKNTRNKLRGKGKITVNRLLLFSKLHDA